MGIERMGLQPRHAKVAVGAASTLAVSVRGAQQAERVAHE